jgi:hypothetical protein
MLKCSRLTYQVRPVERLQRGVVESVLRHLDLDIGVDLVALHEVFGGDFLAGVGIDHGMLMRWPVSRLLSLR